MAWQLPGAHKGAIVLAGVYLAAIVGKWQWVKYAVKPAVTLLAAWPTRRGGSRGVFAGLLFSAVGDVCLMIPGDAMFVPGLVSFLAAHVLYTASFRARMRLSWAAVPLGAFAAAMALRLQPGVAREGGVMQAGVAVYISAIIAMAYKATLTGNAVLTAGSLLFCVSDALLAWAKFVRPHAWSELGVMSTYYAAQLCIAAAHS
ncbi:hypothetical protein H4R21_006643 [Coemansia helicoidea]|uniref:Uncharacterized protein n=1 Tax=Coemansia helicoidea TaxID=1286919 RepID=A0ACC1KI14_9FUNG|nr:hypothetical protein H4R21_006643 [Coemansia helicoidea]